MTGNRAGDPVRAELFGRNNPDSDTILLYCNGCGPGVEGTWRLVLFDARQYACTLCGRPIVETVH